MTDLSIINEDDLQFEENPEVLPQALREGQQQNYDQSWKAHRAFSIRSINRIEWAFPSSKKDREEGNAPYKEVTGHSSHHFCAVRGIPIGFYYGASLDDNSDSKNPVNICHTTRLVEHLGENSKDTVDRHPLRFPFGQMHQSKANPHQYATRLDKPHLELYGSRPPVGLDKDAAYSEPRTCKSCVEAGEHYIGEKELFDKPGANFSKCSMSGYMYIVVFQLGVYDASDVLDGGEPTIKWVNIKDAKLQTMEGDKKVPLERPFVLKLNGLTKTQHSSLGTGTYDRNVIKEEHVPSEIYSAGDYFNYLHDTKFTGKRHRVLKGGEICYPTVTEIHCGKLAAQQYGADYIPVFSPVTDKEVIDAGIGWTEIDWLRTALSVFKLEREVANGKASFEAAPKLPELQAVASATQEGVEEEEPKAKQENAAVPTSVLNAFKPKSAAK